MVTELYAVIGTTYGEEDQAGCLVDMWIEAIYSSDSKAIKLSNRLNKVHETEDDVHYSVSGPHDLNLSPFDE